MMGHARLKTLVAVAAALILATVGVAVQGRQQPGPKGTQEQAKTPPPPIKTPPPPEAGVGVAVAVADLAVNRALARKQLVLIDEAWALMEFLSKNARIDIDGGTFGPWGRRRLDALRRAGAGKAEIVAALEKYIIDLERMQAIVEAQQNRSTARVKSPSDYEIRFLRMEAEIWLNEEKAR